MIFPPKSRGGSLRLAIEEIDIWRTATTLLKQHDFITVAFIASHETGDRERSGDLEGAAVWKQIEAKIEELKRIGYLLHYSQESAWREDARRVDNGTQVRRVTELALLSKPSVDFSGYYQRHIQKAA